MTQFKEKEKKFSFIKPEESKMLQQKQTKKSQGQGEKKEKVAFLILIFFAQFIILLIYWIRKWNSRLKVQNSS